MQIIIKRGTNASSFPLSNGRVVVLRPEPVMNEVSDEDFGRLLVEYGSFIRPRVHSDKNPDGCFIINDKALKAADHSKEAGKLKDGSAPASKKDLKNAGKKRKKNASSIEIKTPVLNDSPKTEESTGNTEEKKG